MSWLRRIRGALGMALVWAAGGWCIGGLIELIYNILPGFPLGPLVDIWPAVLAVVGFVGGGVSSAVIAIAGRNRRFDELSLPGFAAWGGLGGLLLGVLMIVPGLDGPLLPEVWARIAATIGVTTLGSATAASGSLWIARKSEDRALLDASADVAEVGLSERERKELLGGGR